MDVRKRTAFVRSGRENPTTTLPGKEHEALKVTKPQQRRLVLGEISNRVVTRQNATKPLPFHEVKKKVVTKQAVTNVSKEVPNKEDKAVKKTEKVPPPTAPKPDPVSFSSSQFSVLNVINIDKDDANDPLLLGVYANDIYTYLRVMEAKYPIRKNYLKENEVTGRMREILVDWIIDVNSRFKNFQETLYLTVSNLDRFMQGVTDISRKNFQLVGIAAMYIACKYEEIYSPEVSDLVYISDNACSKSEVLEMEARIIKALDFSFGRPLAPHFLRRYSKAAQAQSKQHCMAKYFMELCLVDYEMCHIPPSLIAATALYLSLRLSSGAKEKIWTDTLMHYSQYSYKDICPVVKRMAHLILRAENSHLQAVRKKYASNNHLKISCASELSSSLLQRLAQS